MQQDTDYTRIFLAIFLAAIILIGWQALVEFPRRQHLAQIATEESKKVAVMKAQQDTVMAKREAVPEENQRLSREERLALSPRLAIDTPTLHGSIALKGARFDDLSLVKYHETIDDTSPQVRLFAPQGDIEAYFTQIGWLSPDNSTRVPDGNSLWQADKRKIGANESTTLRWDNGEGVTFVLTISLDENYMFTIAQRVENHSARTVSVAPYAYINRSYNEPAQHYAIMHEGPMGVMTGQLEEISYKDLREKNNRSFDNAAGWFGVTDKYWLSALIPGENGFKATFSHYTTQNRDRYQADYLGAGKQVAAGASDENSVRLFAGAKEIRVIDYYTDGDGVKQIPPIPLFDRAVDFGSLYFLTKPMFLTLNFFYTRIGNFGIAIMLLTVVVKLAMFPLANKSYKSMGKMRLLQPEVMKLRERYVDDQIRMQQEMMALYKKEKVNPASGCLPILIQMPVFFALYKVLFVTIEMRHAPFFGWIRDLSVPDPSNIFTAFGLIPWNAPAWMHLGILPILMCATMVIQMKQQPSPPDPVQAKMMSFMPYFFLIVFAKFPAGLVLYWVWSNMLSILQQHVISSRHAHLKPPKPAKEKKTA